MVSLSFHLIYKKISTDNSILSNDNMDQMIKPSYISLPSSDIDQAQNYDKMLPSECKY